MNARILVAALMVAGLVSLPAAPAGAASSCGPLAAPNGKVVRVSPAQANDLPQIVANASSGTTILLDDGVYSMTTSGESDRRVQFRTRNGRCGRRRTMPMPS